MTEYKAAVTGEAEGTFRQFLSYLFKQDTTGVASDGILGGLAVGQTTTASSGVLVGLGSAVVQDSLLNGASPLISNAVKTLDVLTANPMGATPRNDIVVFDAATVALTVVTGVPNAVPTDPTLPTTAVPLARLRHAASATTVPAAKIDDLRVTTSLAQAADRKTLIAVQAGSVTLDTGWQSAVPITLPVGKWLVTVEGQFDWTPGTAGRQFTLSFNSAGSSSIYQSAIFTAPSTLTGKAWLSLAIDLNVTTAMTPTYAAQVKENVGGYALFYSGRIIAQPVDY